MPLSYDPEYLKAAEPLLTALASAPKPAVGDTAARRAGLEAMIGGLYSGFPDIHDVERSIHHVGDKTGHDVPIHRFVKKGTSTSTQPGPAIVHFHGGGYICLSVDLYARCIEIFASSSSVQIFSVDYRVAPEFKFPVPVEDCYLGL
jgi:acetyl esterase/lipase